MAVNKPSCRSLRAEILIFFSGPTQKTRQASTQNFVKRQTFDGSYSTFINILILRSLSYYAWISQQKN